MKQTISKIEAGVRHKVPEHDNIILNGETYQKGDPIVVRLKGSDQATVLQIHRIWEDEKNGILTQKITLIGKNINMIVLNVDELENMVEGKITPSPKPFDLGLSKEEMEALKDDKLFKKK